MTDVKKPTQAVASDYAYGKSAATLTRWQRLVFRVKFYFLLRGPVWWLCRVLDRAQGRLMWGRQEYDEANSRPSRGQRTPSPGPTPPARIGRR